MRMTRENIDRHVGARIRGLREAAGETPQGLAGALHLEAAALREIEAGARSCDAFLLCCIAELFARDINYFFQELPPLE